MPCYCHLCGLICEVPYALYQDWPVPVLQWWFCIILFNYTVDGVVFVQIRLSYGAPISRRRIYLLMIKESALTDEALAADFTEFIKGKLESMHHPSNNLQWLLVTPPFTYAQFQILLVCFAQIRPYLLKFFCPRKDLLLPNDHPAVQKDMRKRQKRRIEVSKGKLLVPTCSNQLLWQFVPTCSSIFWLLEIAFPRFNKHAKWIQKHKEWAKENKASSSFDFSTDWKYLISARSDHGRWVLQARGNLFPGSIPKLPRRWQAWERCRQGVQVCMSLKPILTRFTVTS